MSSFAFRSYDIVEEFNDIIIAQLFGHLHTDEFRVGGIFAAAAAAGDNDDNDNVDVKEIPSSISTPLLLGASVSPLHGNDPSFRLVRYNRGGGGGRGKHHFRLVDYESHAFSFITQKWSKLYTFSEAYGEVLAANTLEKEGLSSNIFRAIVISMEDKVEKGEGRKDENAIEKQKRQRDESPILKVYRTFMLSGAEGDAFNRGANVDCDSRCRDEFLCTFQSATRAGYDDCLSGRREAEEEYESSQRRGVFGLVGAAAVVIAIVILAFVKCRKRQSCLRHHRIDYDSPPSVHDDAEEEGGIDL